MVGLADSEEQRLKQLPPSLPKLIEAVVKQTAVDMPSRRAAIELPTVYAAATGVASPTSMN